MKREVKWVSLLGVLALLLFATWFVLQVRYKPKSSGHALVKVWESDLGLNASYNKRLAASEVDLYPPAINFLDDSTIICGFYSGQLFVPGEEPKDSTYHVVGIDAVKGAISQEITVNAVSQSAKALPINGDRFVVFDGAHLQLFGNNFAPIPGYSDPTARVKFEPLRAKIDVTPNQERIVLFYGSNDGGFNAQWLSANDFAEASRLTGVLSFFVGASGDALLGYERNGGLVILHSDRTSRTSCANCGGEFINDKLLFVHDNTRYHIETIDGKMLVSGRLDLTAGNFTRSLFAPRIAYVTGAYTSSTSQYTGISGDVVVFDWNTEQMVSELKWEEPITNPSAGLNQMSLALSPDGKLLAVLLHHTLTLYRLPL